MRPNTRAYRDAGIKLVFKSWDGIADLNVRRITSRTVEDWLRRFKANAKPHVPRGATAAARNSTGASATTIKCALDAVRQILDIAVASGHLYANPARNITVGEAARRMFKTVRAERGTVRLPTRLEFLRLVDAIREAGVADCRAAANYVQFVAFCGARKNEAAHVHWSDVDTVRGTSRSDFWLANAEVFPSRTHRLCGKAEGQTNHAERFFCTLRQRLGRFVRKTLSFSKCERMHELALRVFIHEYNQRPVS